MKLCFAHLYYNLDNTARERDDYLDWVNLRPLAEAMAARGHEVHVVHLFPRNDSFVKNGVQYHFVASGWLARKAAHLVRRLWHRPPAASEPALRSVRKIRSLQPDVIHFHGAILTLNLFFLLIGLGRRRPPLVVQYHGGHPSPKRWLRPWQRFNFQRVDRLFFGTRWHVQPFDAAGVLSGDDRRIVELMEVSTPFKWRSRAEARDQTGMAGDPVFLWAGRLHAVKDPLTALRGFDQILAAWPDAQLYLYYITAELLPELEAFVTMRPKLAGHVHFRGCVDRLQMETIYNSADFLLQASLREYSGYAVLEAMACGVVPVVTDIPALRAMTAGGRYGILFPPGDVSRLVAGVLAFDRAQLAPFSKAIREHFGRELSFAAMTRQLEQVYKEVVRERERR